MPVEGKNAFHNRGGVFVDRITGGPTDLWGLEVCPGHQLTLAQVFLLRGPTTVLQEEVI